MSAKALYNQGIFKGTALKSLFFGYFLFGRKESNSARRADTARLRAIAKEEYSVSRSIGVMSIKFAVAHTPMQPHGAHGNILPQAKFLSHHL